MLVPLLGETPREMKLEATKRRSPLASAPIRSIRGSSPTRFRGEREPVNLRNVRKAIASFERTIISGDSPYDRLVWKDDRGALSGARPARHGALLLGTASPARSATPDSRFRGPPPGRAGRSPSPRSTTTDSAAASARRPSGTSRSPLLTCTTGDSRRSKRSSTTTRRAESPRPAGALSSAASASPKPRSAISWSS